jgi:hypothetical protein
VGASLFLVMLARQLVIWDSYCVLMMQLPDYHDVIDHPMDFSTVRRKLARNIYRSFEQFEVRLLVSVACLTPKV